MSEVYANILTSLTTGLYIQVNIAIREYLQNAYDAIKSAKLQGLPEPIGGFRVEVKVTKDHRIVTISDNGIGMSRVLLEEYTSIGGGTKNSPDFAGHKGIGKLAGLRFFKNFVVRTKEAGIQKGYELHWRSGDMMKVLLSEPGKMKKIPYNNFIRDYYEIRDFQEPNAELHFTQVQLVDAMDEFKEQINENKIGEFILVNCPVPFLPNAFEPAEEIEKFLGTGFIPIITYINEKVIYQPYRDNLNLAPPRLEEIRYGDHIRAKGWFSWVKNSAEGLGEEKIRGLRFRCKGLCVGDRNLFANNCMPEGRSQFADWFTGEICVLDDIIRPNTARDGFEKSEAVRYFYNELKKRLGKKLSSLADVRSEIHAAEQHLAKVAKLIAENKTSIQSELMRLAERSKNLQRKRDSDEFNINFSVINKIEELLKSREKILVKETDTAKDELKEALDDGNTGEILKKLIELKAKEVQSSSKDTKKEISSLIDKTIKEVIKKDLVKPPKDILSPQEEIVLKILIEYLNLKQIAYVKKEVKDFVRQALKS